MNELQKILTNIKFVPPWAHEFLTHLVGVLCVLIVLNLILKNLQTPQMEKALKALKELGRSAMQDISKSMKLPVERPRLELVALVLFMINSYLMAFVFFVFFCVLLYFSVSAEYLEFWRRIAAIGITLFFLFLARFFYADSERQRLVVIEKWRARK